MSAPAGSRGSSDARDLFLAAAALFVLSIVPVVQQLREARFYRTGNQEFAERWLFQLPATFAGRQLRIVDTLPHSGDWTEDARPGEAALYVDDSLALAPATVQIRDGHDDIGRYHRWIAAAAFTRRDGTDSVLLVARRRARAAPFLIDVLTVRADGSWSVEQTSEVNDASWPRYRALSKLGYEDRPLYRFTYWTALPFLLLALTGPWMGVVASLGLLGAGLLLRRRDRSRAV